MLHIKALPVSSFRILVLVDHLSFTFGRLPIVHHHADGTWESMTDMDWFVNEVLPDQYAHVRVWDDVAKDDWFSHDRIAEKIEERDGRIEWEKEKVSKGWYKCDCGTWNSPEEICCKNCYA